jgi:hypothetical protein
MGLCISVGSLANMGKDDPEAYEWLQQALVEVNRMLGLNDLPLHEEPETLPKFKSRCTASSQPYDWLHYLRRAVAYAICGKKLKPISRDDDPSEDPVYSDVFFESHVVHHSDCDGFYVPIDFPEPLFDELDDEDEHCVAGGIVGSSQAAMRELVLTAPLLGIPLRDGKLSDGQARALNREKEEGTPFYIERQVWFDFFEAARLSIKYNTVINFT